MVLEPAHLARHHQVGFFKHAEMLHDAEPRHAHPGFEIGQCLSILPAQRIE